MIRNERGMAIVAVLLVLTGLTVLVLAISANAVLEKNVSTNQHLAARALYAADSGIEAGRQTITDFAQSRLDSLTNAWAGNGPIIAAPNQFFPVNGVTVNFGGTPSFASLTEVTFEDSALQLQSQAYNFRYRTTANGTFRDGRRTLISEGRLRISATRGSFADYLIFTNTHAIPGGSPIWFHTTGHFDGRVHTNGEFRFAEFPTFEDLTASVHQMAWFYNKGNNIERNSDHNGTRDVPNFYGGFDRGVDPVSLPTNSFSQERAALGGNAGSTVAVTNSEIRGFLGLAAGSSAPPDGVYVPNSGGAVSGGVYVSGEAKQVKLSVDGAYQVMRITDSANRVTLIRVNHSTNRTEVTRPSASMVTYTGVPRGALYAKGRITDLRGPDRVSGQPPPAIQRDHQMTIISNSDIVIQRDLKYQDFDSGENVLGIFSSGGNVRIGSTAPTELIVDSYVMASANQKVFTVDGYDTGSYRGQLHLRGGMVTNYYGAFGTFGNSLTGYGRDFRYDRRGFVPPYYPLTARFSPDRPVPNVLAWREVES